MLQLVADNPYGHPHEEVLDALLGRIVLHNDIHGRVHVWSDGQRMWVDTQRNLPNLMVTQETLVHSHAACRL